MASTPTTNLLLEKQGKFENTETWDELLNAAIDQIDYAISGTAAIATTGGTTTLDNANYTVDDAKAAVLYVTGTLASNSEIVVPSTSRVYVVRNATSGAYSVTVKTAAGSGVVVTQGTVQFVGVDATADDTYAISVAGALGVASDSGTASVDLETQSLTLTGGTGIDTSATGQAATIAIDSTVATLTGAQTLENKTLTSLGDVTFQTGASGGTLRTGTSAADKFILQGYDVNSGVYRDVIELDAGNDVVLQIIADYLAIEDATDTTKHVEWDVSGATASTATTLDFNQTANRTITVPDATGTLMLTSAIGSTVQAYAANLDTWAGIAPSANGSSLVSAANYAAMRTLLDLEAGTDFYSISAADAAFQPLDAVLTDLAGLTLAQGEVLYFNGTNLVALGVGTNGQVLTSGGPAANVSWTAAGAGDVSSSAVITDNALVRGDGGAKGVQETGIIVADTTNDLSGVGSITPVAGSALRTATTATNTLLLQAYDVDGAAYTTFGTLTAGNTPSFTLSSPIISTPALSADSVDAITEIAAALKSGADGTLVTGTAGTSGYLGAWNADGDLVQGSYDSPSTFDIFTSGGTWTKPTGLTRVRVTVVGGGGGGGGAASTTGTQYSCGGGGGAGGVSVVYIEAASLGATETVTIGAGGAGGTATVGSNGGTSSFGAHASATGGGGGNYLIASTSSNRISPSSDPGIGSSGDVNFSGSPGGFAVQTDSGQVLGATGGSTPFGGGGYAIRSNGTGGQDGQAATGYGSGGGGAFSHTNAANRTGGAGAGGIVIVEEIY